MPASTGKARITGLIGSPVTHSLSPLIHEYWLKQAAIDGCYLPFRQRSSDLPCLIEGLRQLDIRGFNVTVPYKQAMLAYLDTIDPQAESIGAVNTVVVEGEGKWTGYNTDGKGFLHSLSHVEGWGGDRRVTLLGAGGAARAIAHALEETGQFLLTLVNRDGAKARMLADELERKSARATLTVPWENREAALSGCDLLINTTTLGMESMPKLELSLDTLPAHAVVADIVYAPLETDLLRAARARGLQTVDGLGMLLGQAAEAFRLWHGVSPVVDEALRQKLIAAQAKIP